MVGKKGKRPARDSIVNEFKSSNSTAIPQTIDWR